MKITAQHRNWLLGGISLYALARSLAANAAERGFAEAAAAEGDAPAVRYMGVKWRPKFKRKAKQ